VSGYKVFVVIWGSFCRPLGENSEIDQMNFRSFILLFVMSFVGLG